MKSLYDGSIWAFNCVTLDASLLHDCWKEKPVPYLKKISLFNTTAKWTTLLIPWLWTQRSKCWALIVKTWSSEYNYEPWMPVLMGNVPISWNKPLFRPWNIQVLLGWFLVPSIHFWCTRTLQVPCVHFWCTHTPLIPCVHFLLWCTLHYGVEKIFEVFLGIGILLVIINFFVPTLVTRFWYFVYTSSDHKGVRMVPCVHFWCMCTLGTLRTLLVLCVHFRYLAYTFGVRVHFCVHLCVHFSLWCWKNFRSLFGYQHFLLVNTKIFFFSVLVTGFWYLAYTLCERRGVRWVPCVHFWCMRTLQVPCVHLWCTRTLLCTPLRTLLRTLVVYAPLWCWKNFRSLFGYQLFVSQHQLFFFFFDVGNLFAYTSCERRGVRMVPCVHFWCMCTLLVPCIHFWCMRTLLVYAPLWCWKNFRSIFGVSVFFFFFFF